jgi:signal transduction histidine kinase/CheY-like chemotaxis protein/HPt (histidine-containing phosphotransfer) domain-containing protein
MNVPTRRLALRSIQARFLAITVSLVLLSTLPLFAVYEFNTHRVALDDLSLDLNELANTQSAVLSDPLWNLDDKQVQLVLAALASNRDVLGARVLDDVGKVFASVGVAGATPRGAEVLVRGIVFNDDGNYEVVGRLEVTTTDARVRAATWSRLSIVALMASLVVLALALSAFVAHRRIIGVPLQRLIASIHQAKRGGARQRVEWDSADEMGALVTEFNDMQERQESYEANLRAARDNLEQRVEERTEELASARDEALEARTQLTDALESISEGFALYGPDDRLVLSNSRYRELLYPGIESELENGMQFESILRRAVDLGLIADVDSDPEAYIRARIALHREPTGPVEQRRADGRWVQVSERRTDTSGTVAVYTDVTELKRRQDQLSDLVAKLQQARDEAEAANSAKSAFLATMSHEIRTPMNAVIGMTSLLLSTPLNGEQREFTEVIRNSSDDLLTIINDILDFSKIEAGKLEVERAPFDLRECMEGALDLLAARATDKGLELAYLVESGTPGAIGGDMTRLRQILVNLLSNAVKFTQEGEVVLSVSARPLPPDGDDDAGHELHFVVHDTGIGIPEDRMGRLFGSFSQVDASTTRRFGGTGLGLAISKRLCELMGGSMWAESVTGEGSTFHFTIQVGPAPASPVDALDEIQPLLESKRVLVVDDNATNLRIVTLQTRSWGMMPVPTDSPIEALEWVERGDLFDIAVLDMQMPVMDGLELGRRIRASEGGRALPLVMLTSLGESEREARETGFDVFLHKPVKPSQLFNGLAGALAGRPVRVGAPHTAPVAEFDANMGRERPLTILLAEDNVTNQKLATRLLERMGYRADIAANGIEVLDALRRQPYDMVLMDMQMPEMDGLEATQRIRAQEGSSKRPFIVAMTANAMPGDREACLEAGMDDYVSKPIRVAKLVDALRRGHEAIDAPGPGSTPPAVEPAPGPPPAVLYESGSSAEPRDGPVDPAAVARLREMLGGQEYLDELLEAFLEDAPALLEQLRLGLDEGDAELFARAAHSLKSNTAEFGATQMAGLCRELEEHGHAGALDGLGDQVTRVQVEYARVSEALQALRGGG